MACYHLLYGYLLPWGTSEHVVLHVGLSVSVILLAHLLESNGSRFYFILILLLATIFSLFYFLSSVSVLETKFGIGLSGFEIFMGAVFLIIVIIVTRIEWGLVLSSVVVIALVYFFFGSYIPGPLRAPKLPSVEYGMTYLIAGGSAGLFGQITPISAYVIFLFLVFGSLLNATGVTSMFLELGKIAGRLVKGGSAVTAVVASSMLGTITGVTIANAAITGSFTIPSMKREGFRAEDAAAIESVASCGGQILPPIMGTGAFIMASFLGVPYIDIIKMALVPGILYYVTVFIALVILIRHKGISVSGDAVDFRLIRNKLPAFVIPLIVLAYFLMIGGSPNAAVSYAILTTIFFSFIRWDILQLKGVAGSLKQLFDGFVEGARQGAAVGVVIGAISIVTQVLITTAAGAKISVALSLIAGDSILLALILCMFACLILGFGLPTVAAYTVVAITVAPGLHRLGVDLSSAHLFTFYFAVYAAVTPPIATAVIVTSKIAKSPFWSTAWSAMKFMVTPILLPFVFVYQPSLLQFPNVGINIVFPIIVTLLISLMFAIITEKTFLIRTDIVDTGLSILAIISGLAWASSSKYYFIVISVVFVLILTGKQLFLKKKFMKAV
jgi:TRAP transporter 4TM/12TM fusion protein